jgi:hypothetical protein
MKKAILFSFALFLGTAAFAQQKKGAATTTTTKEHKTSKVVVTHTGQCYADKTWKLTKVEKFGVEQDPSVDMKGDLLRLNGDGTFKVVLKGVEKSGTYSKGGSWLNLKPTDGSEVMPYKIMSCEGNNMQADWRDGDTHNLYTYKAE